MVIFGLIRVLLSYNNELWKKTSNNNTRISTFLEDGDPCCSCDVWLISLFFPFHSILEPWQPPDKEIHFSLSVWERSIYLTIIFYPKILTADFTLCLIFRLVLMKNETRDNHLVACKIEFEMAKINC